MNLEMMKRAKLYVDEMLMGINPVTKEVVENETINEDKVINCLGFVSSLLNKEIEKEIRKEKRRLSTIPFRLTKSEKEKFLYTQDLNISELVKRINELKINYYMMDLKVTDVTKWLVVNGFLEVKILDNKKRKVPTEKGKNLGIYIDYRIGIYGGYEVVMYRRKMQEYIVNNLDSICKFASYSNFEDVLI